MNIRCNYKEGNSSTLNSLNDQPFCVKIKEEPTNEEIHSDPNCLTDSSFISNIKIKELMEQDINYSQPENLNNGLLTHSDKIKEEPKVKEEGFSHESDISAFLGSSSSPDQTKAEIYKSLIHNLEMEISKLNSEKQETLVDHDKKYPYVEDIKMLCCTVVLEPLKMDCHQRLASNQKDISTTKKQFTCQLCSYRTTTKYSLTTHFKCVHLRNEQYSSNKCNIGKGAENGQYSSNDSGTSIVMENKSCRQRRYMKNHEEGKKFSCDKCSYETNKKCSFKHHIETHLLGRSYHCGKCPNRFKTRKSLQHHMIIHSVSNPYRCKQCSYKTFYRHSLTSHLKVHSNSKPFSCSQCSYRSRYKTSLLTHYVTHSEDKPHKCSVCSYRAKSKYVLGIHMRSHTGDKPYRCSICPYSARQGSHLKVHVRMHLKQKPYICNICSFKTSQTTHLKTHMSIHSDERPYSCGECSYKAKLRHSLLSHIKTHTGEKPYKCKYCPYRAAQSSCLKGHIVRNHLGDKSHP